MPINPQLLISAAMLQDYLVDDTTGLPLANGTVTMYQDNSRTTLKNWYYQTGTPGNYTYITLPNPLTLSSVGTITDGNGNDTIPFYYPYSEVDNVTFQPYYVVVVNSNGQQQFTRQNFPFVASKTPSGTSIATNKNLIVNGEFWRNRGSINVTNPDNPITLNGNSFFYSTLCPSQHDGYTAMSDIQFFKNANGAADTVTFNSFVVNASPGLSFPDQVIPNDVTPQYYLNMNCSSAGTETSKYIQIPIQLHIDSLSGLMSCSCAIDAMATTGSPVITLSLLQYRGTGMTSPAAIAMSPASVTLTQNWQKYIFSFNFPTAQNLALNTQIFAGRDDAFYLQIGFPTNASGGTYNINIAKPGIYLSQTVPTNDFSTYDEINSVISSPRTGDFRTSFNSFSPMGWVSCNNSSSIGGVGSGASLAIADTWPLYNLLWNNVNQAFAAVAGGSRGASAAADFTSPKAMTLPAVLGSVLMGLPVSQNFTYVNGTGIFTVASNINFYIGSPVIMTNVGGAIPSGFSLGTVYYAIPIAGSTTTLQVATTYANAIAGTAFVPASNNGSGTNTFNFALAGNFGEGEHTMTTNELVSHTHTYLQAGTPQPQSGNTTNCFTANSTQNTGSMGNSAPFNVVQPSVYTNMFIKL